MQPSESRITILLPVKNGMPFLPETLASLAAQTHQNFAILAWDNGSTDGSAEELKRWIPGKIAGQVITDQPLPLHLCLARMTEVADTPFCARIDADDLALPDRLEKQITFLLKNPKVAVVGGQMEFIDEKGAVIGRADFLPTSFEAILSTILYQCPLPHPGIMFRRESVLQVGNYQKPSPVEDIDLWLRLAAVGKMVNLSDLVLKYRVHPKSVTMTAKREGQHLKQLLECLKSGVPKLFAISEETYSQLIEKRHPLAIVPLSTIASSIARLSGTTKAQVMSLPQFLYSARCLTSNKDIFSKLAYFYLGRDRSISIFQQALIKASFLPGIRNTVHWRKQRQRQKRIHRWEKFRRREGSTIEAVVFQGAENWESFIETGTGIVLEKEVTVAFNPEKNSKPYLRIGSGVFIGRNTFLSVYDSVEIEPDVLIGAYSYITSNNHAFGTRALPIKKQGYTYGPVKIKEGAWLGTRVVILPNVTIGTGAIVAAGSVVTKNVPDYEIWGGSPAVKIKDRP